jgi:cyclopropane fatty-acyl-phospholipid synthase-like methyltransferase
MCIRRRRCLGDLRNANGKFDFAYDWELLHHIYPEQRERYVANVHGLRNPKGKHFSLCFSERDTAFGGAGKYRRTQLGTVLYFSSEDELRVLFEPFFTILEPRTVEINGKWGSHLASYCFMQREGAAVQ